MDKIIRRLTSVDKEACERMLARAFGSSRGFTVSSAGSSWNPADDYYVNLGAFHGSQLVSSLRVEWVQSESELSYKLLTDLKFPHVTFPCVYLTKAGTWPELKTSGLNSLLRYWALKLAESWQARYVFGTMVEGSPRIFTMSEMGYSFEANPRKWNGNFRSDRTPLIACLDLSLNRDRAFQYLEKQLGDRLKEYQTRFSFEDCAIRPPAALNRKTS